MSEGINIYPHDKFNLLHALIDFYATAYGEEFELDKWFTLQKKYNNFFCNITYIDRDKIEKESVKKLIDFLFEEIAKLDPNLTIDSYK